MKRIVTLLLIFMSSFYCFAQVKVNSLLTENLLDPISIDAANPRFSWKLIADGQHNVLQTAYEIKVLTGKRTVWQTGKVMSDQSVYVDYKGETLAAQQKYTWQVKVWDNSGKASDWSKPASFQMGLLTPADWKAQWITPGYVEDSIMRPSPLFRKEFSLFKKK